jgi:hypothetical protein
MLSRTWHRLTTWIAFVASLALRPLARFVAVPLALPLAFLLVALAPRVAAAAILPACESHELTRTPPEWLAPTPTILPDACSIGEIANDEDLGDARVAAMCSDSGASMVAPPRLVPVIDARIDRAPGCVAELDCPVIGPSSHDSPAVPPPFAVTDHALLGGGVLVPPAPYTLAPAFPVVVGAPRAGVRHALDHPPR